jgi:inhibitor of cysteine peptidase
MQAWGAAALLCMLLGRPSMDLEVTEQSNGKEITVPVGQEFRLSLPENPTTGYVWHLVKKGEPECALIRDSFQASSHHVGGPGMHEWLFRAESPGRVSVEMRLARKWERDSATRSFLLLVHVT